MQEQKAKGKWIRLAALWQNRDSFGTKLVSNNMAKQLANANGGWDKERDGYCVLNVRDNNRKSNKGFLDAGNEADCHLLLEYKDIDKFIDFLQWKKKDHEERYGLSSDEESGDVKKKLVEEAKVETKVAGTAPGGSTEKEVTEEISVVEATVEVAEAQVEKLAEDKVETQDAGTAPEGSTRKEKKTGTSTVLKDMLEEDMTLREKLLDRNTKRVQEEWMDTEEYKESRKNLEQVTQAQEEREAKKKDEEES